jgi:hypothetical protein
MAALRRLSKDERLFVYREWLQRVDRDPTLAVGVLLWTRYGVALPGQGCGIVLSAAAPKLLQRWDLRNGIRKVLAKKPDMRLAIPSAVAEAIHSDEDKEGREQEEEERRRLFKEQALEQYCQIIAEMTFEKRVHALSVNDLFGSRTRVSVQKWLTEWALCSDEEMDGLSADQTRQLIDLCERSAFFRSSGVIRRLYDRRHALRQVAMDEIRQKYSFMSSRDLLTELVTIGSIPIEHFPVELAGEVTSDWFQALPDNCGQLFRAKLSTCKLRVWAKACRKLSLVPTNE